MAWYWWALIGLYFGVGLFFAVMAYLFSSQSSDLHPVLEAARMLFLWPYFIIF